jgi:hypothetical protein
MPQPNVDLVMGMAAPFLASVAVETLDDYIVLFSAILFRSTGTD